MKNAYENIYTARKDVIINSHPTDYTASKLENFLIYKFIYI